jgi:hypothetical protein
MFVSIPSGQLERRAQFHRAIVEFQPAEQRHIMPRLQLLRLNAQEGDPHQVLDGKLRRQSHEHSLEGQVRKPFDRSHQVPASDYVLLNPAFGTVHSMFEAAASVHAGELITHFHMRLYLASQYSLKVPYHASISSLGHQHEIFDPVQRYQKHATLVHDQLNFHQRQAHSQNRLSHHVLHLGSDFHYIQDNDASLILIQLLTQFLSAFLSLSSKLPYHRPFPRRAFPILARYTLLCVCHS